MPKRLGEDRLKRALEGGEDGPLPIKRLKNGEQFTVRFLTQPDEWGEVREFFAPSLGPKGKGWPLLEGEPEPDINGGRVSKAYWADVLDVTGDKTLVLRVPIGLGRTLYAYYLRNNNDLTTRDYTIQRTGDERKPTYVVFEEPEFKRPLTKYERVDQDALEHRLRAIAGVEEDGSGPVTGTANRPLGLPGTPRPDLDDDDLTDDDVPAPAVEDEDEAFTDDAPDEAETDDLSAGQPAEEGVEYWTREELEPLTLGTLRKVAIESEIDPTGLTKDQLVNVLLGEDPDYVEPF